MIAFSLAVAFIMVAAVSYNLHNYLNYLPWTWLNLALAALFTAAIIADLIWMTNMLT